MSRGFVGCIVGILCLCIAGSIGWGIQDSLERIEEAREAARVAAAHTKRQEVKRAAFKASIVEGRDGEAMTVLRKLAGACPAGLRVYELKDLAEVTGAELDARLEVLWGRDLVVGKRARLKELTQYSLTEDGGHFLLLHLAADAPLRLDEAFASCFEVLPTSLRRSGAGFLEKPTKGARR